MGPDNQQRRIDEPGKTPDVSTLYQQFLAGREAVEEGEFERFCAEHPGQARKLRVVRHGDCPDARSRSLSFLPLTDEQRSYALLREAQAGDREALNELLERYYERVRRITRIRMSSRLQRLTDPEDVVQRSFLVAVRELGTLQVTTSGSLIQWLTRIVENQIRDAVRYHGAQSRDPDLEVPLQAGDSLTHTAPEPAAAVPTPSRLASDEEIKAIYDECVEQLPDDQREVLLLRDYAGLDWPAIAKELGRPNITATQKHYYRSQLRLASLLRQRLSD